MIDYESKIEVFDFRFKGFSEDFLWTSRKL